MDPTTTCNIGLSLLVPRRKVEMCVIIFIFARGLDYPPLTAFHSLLCGIMFAFYYLNKNSSISSCSNYLTVAKHASAILLWNCLIPEDTKPSAVKCKSRYTHCQELHVDMLTCLSHRFMRLSVLASDLVFFFPIVVIFFKTSRTFVSKVCGPSDGLAHVRIVLYFFSLWNLIWSTCAILKGLEQCTCPSTTFAYSYRSWSDTLHIFAWFPTTCIQSVSTYSGHFQYNCVCLGLAACGIYFTAKLEDTEPSGGRFAWSSAYLGSFLFCCAVSFKQIGLYLSLPFFFYLLGAAWRSRNSNLGLARRVTVLGLIVAGTFALVLLPWLLASGTDRAVSHVKQILHRVFPFARGIFGCHCHSTVLLSCFTVYISIDVGCIQRTKWQTFGAYLH